METQSRHTTNIQSTNKALKLFQMTKKENTTQQPITPKNAYLYIIHNHRRGYIYVKHAYFSCINFHTPNYSSVHKTKQSKAKQKPQKRKQNKQVNPKPKSTPIKLKNKVLKKQT